MPKATFTGVVRTFLKALVSVCIDIYGMYIHSDHYSAYCVCMY